MASRKHVACLRHYESIRAHVFIYSPYNKPPDFEMSGGLYNINMQISLRPDSLLYCHALGKVAGLIYIQSSCHAAVVAKQL